MIDRELIRNPDKPFDFFNDYEDTSYWLYKLETGKLNPDAARVSEILERRLAEYNKTTKHPVQSQRTLTNGLETT
jgi:hypothetical protein